MASLRYWALLVTSLNLCAAQVDSTGPKVWAVVAYINNGERTPLVGDLETTLTPEGAQQMQRQGDAFRLRYLLSNQTNTDLDVEGNTTIQGIQPNAIDNEQLNLFSLDDSWIGAGAMAFMQGLYPPSNGSYPPSAGGANMSVNWADSADTTSYPLGGYQYPLIETLSNLDSRSTVLDGTANCVAYEVQAWNNMTSQSTLVDLFNSTYSFYQTLFSTPPLAGTIPMDEVQLWNAYLLYDYVNYMYTHNETVYNGLKNANQTLAQLEQNAFQVETAVSSGPASDDDIADIVSTISGRTMSWAVTNLFNTSIAMNAVEYKLNIMFGSFEPLMSFFSLADISASTDTDPDASSSSFSSLPEPGAALIFELVGENNENSNVMPSLDDLSIRTWYRASADPDAGYELQSLFGSGFDGSTMPWTAFLEQVGVLGVSPESWCGVCQANTNESPWCIPPQTPSSGSGSGVSAPVAGVIGAAIMAGMVILLAAGLYVLGGVRLSRSGADQRSSTLGGFKGAEKMASDPDLSTTKAGNKQPRVGSWELRGDDHQVPEQSAAQNRSSVEADGAMAERDVASERRLDGLGLHLDGHDDEEDGISIMGATPTTAHEAV